MRKLLTSALVAGLVLFGAAASQAGTLVSASLFSSFSVSTGGTGLTASGSSTDSLNASVTLSVAPQVTSGSQPGTPTVLSSTFWNGGTQVVNVVGGAASVNQGIAGGVHVDIGGLPHTFAHLFTIPLTVGASANIVTTVNNVLAGQITVTVSALGWQTGAFSALSTSSGAVVGTFATAGANNLTANGGGTLVLIAPSVVKVTVAGAPSTTASASVLVLTFAPSVPEPGTLALLGAGMLGLLAVGRRRA